MPKAKSHESHAVTENKRNVLNVARKLPHKITCFRQSIMHSVSVCWSVFWGKKSHTWISDLHYRCNGCFPTQYVSPHLVVPYSDTTVLVSSFCTFGLGEACILFHSSPTFHMHMPLISTMVWNFTLKLKSLLSSRYLEKIYVLVLLLNNSSLLCWTLNGATYTLRCRHLYLSNYFFMLCQILTPMHHANAVYERHMMSTNHNHTTILTNNKQCKANSWLEPSYYWDVW